MRHRVEGLAEADVMVGWTFDRRPAVSTHQRISSRWAWSRSRNVSPRKKRSRTYGTWRSTCGLPVAMAGGLRDRGPHVIEDNPCHNVPEERPYILEAADHVGQRLRVGQVDVMVPDEDQSDDQRPQDPPPLEQPVAIRPRRPKSPASSPVATSATRTVDGRSPKPQWLGGEAVQRAVGNSHAAVREEQLFPGAGRRLPGARPQLRQNLRGQRLARLAVPGLSPERGRRRQVSLKGLA